MKINSKEGRKEIKPIETECLSSKNVKEMSMIRVLEGILENASVSLLPFQSSMSLHWHCSCCDKMVLKEVENIIELKSNTTNPNLNDLVQIKYCSNT